jgi:hypothetical protein
MAQTPRQAARNQVGAAMRRHRDAGHPEVIAARRELTELNLTEQIKAAVDAAPPLTAAQRERLALILNPGADDGTA